MSPIEKQRILGLIVLVLAALMIATVVGLEWWEQRRARKPWMRCGNPACAYCGGDRSVTSLIDSSLRSVPSAGNQT